MSTAPRPTGRVLHFRRLFSLRSETFLYDQVRALAGHGVPTAVACLVRLRSRERPWATTALLRFPEGRERGGRLASLVGSGFGWTEADVPLWPLCRALLAARLARDPPAIVHAHFGPDGCLVAPVAERLGARLVVTFYGYDVSRLLSHSRRRWERRYAALFERADLLLGISEHVRSALVAIGAPPERTHVQHLGCDVDSFAFRPPAARFDGRTVRCLHVGRLTEKKDPLLLLEAFARARGRVAAAGIALELTIVGDGELFHATRRRVTALGLERCVRLAGSLPHEAVRAELGRAHLYTQHCRTASNADREGLGVSFLEASAAGLPVVGTDHDGIPEAVVHGESGLLSPEGNVEAMAANLAELALAPERWDAFGLAGREHVERRFRMDRVTQRLAQRYAALLSEARPAPARGSGTAAERVPQPERRGG